MPRVLATTRHGEHAETTTHQAAPADGTDAAQLTRRLDWRFLLPQAHLGRVAYVGDGRGLLLRALRVFAESVSLPLQGPVARESADLLVAQSATRSQLAAVVSSVAPGGLVYWEIGRRHRWLSSDWMDLHRLGLESIETFWHYPDFETCELVIPLTTPAPLAWLARRRFATADRRTLLRAARWFCRTPVLWRALPSISVVARRRGTVKGNASW